MNIWQYLIDHVPQMALGIAIAIVYVKTHWNGNAISEMAAKLDTNNKDTSDTKKLMLGTASAGEIAQMTRESMPDHSVGIGIDTSHDQKKTQQIPNDPSSHM